MKKVDDIVRLFSKILKEKAREGDNGPKIGAATPDFVPGRRGCTFIILGYVTSYVAKYSIE